MSWWEWLISIILFLVSLTVLIALHELGHLSMAKLFNVYCQEYSIGFGPALLKKKRKNGETYFSIRAIPFGGYVSMYGEETQLEEGIEVPPERSIEGIKKWKKIIIVSAGVVTNAVLALTLIFISNVAFPIIRTTSFTKVSETSIAYQAGVRDNDKLQIYYPKSQEVIDDGETKVRPFATPKGEGFFVVDPNVTFNEHHYVLTYYPVTTKHDNVLSECLTLYVAADKEKVASDQELSNLFLDWTKEENAPDYYPNFNEKFIYKTEDIHVNLRFKYQVSENETAIKSIDLTLSTKDGKVQDFGVSLKIENIWLPFSQRLSNTFVDFGEASIVVFKGIGSLFTGGIKNMSGIVGIFNLSAQLYGNYAFATYLYFWGLISINLAIFNLLPFPGLDGWQILVTSVEGISKKKIPDKVKTIVSFVGLALLFALMIAIVVMDVLRIAGVM